VDYAAYSANELGVVAISLLPFSTMPSYPCSSAFELFYCDALLESLRAVVQLRGLLVRACERVT
jgi:hypothetical protein